MANKTIDDVVSAPQQAQVPASSALSVHSQFSIESLEDRYRINGIMYQGRVHTVDVSKALLDNGANHTQPQWIEMTQQTEWKLASGPLYFAVMGALYDNRGSPTQKSLVEEVRKMFASDFRKYFMITSTRVCYSSTNPDTVKHNVGYASERAEQADIVGPYGFVNGETDFSASMHALIGTDDCSRVKQVGVWFTGQNSYLYRINAKPQSDVECALLLVDYIDGFYFNAYNYFDDYRRARGMVARSAENS